MLGAPGAIVPALVLAEDHGRRHRYWVGAHTAHLRTRGRRWLPFAVPDGTVGVPSLLAAIMMDRRSPPT